MYIIVLNLRALFFMCYVLCCVSFRSSPDELVALADKHRNVRIFHPTMASLEREELYHGWKKAVQRTFGWIEKKKNNNNHNTNTNHNNTNHNTNTNTINNTKDSLKMRHQAQLQQPSFVKAPISIPSHSITRPNTSTCACTCTSTGTTAAVTSALRIRAPIFSQLAILGAGMIVGAGITAAVLGK